MKSLRLLPILLCILPSTELFSQYVNKPVLSNSMEIKLPKNFKKMSNDLLSTKYSPNNKPSEAYTNEEATVNITFKETEQKLKQESVFEEGKKIEVQLVSKGRIQLIKSEQIKINGNNTHVFSFYSNAIDTKVYNVIFVLSLKGKMVLGSFNCTYAQQTQWQSSANDIINSIRVIK